MFKLQERVQSSRWTCLKINSKKKKKAFKRFTPNSQRTLYERGVYMRVSFKFPRKRPQARTNYLRESGTPQGRILCVRSNLPSPSGATLFCCHGDTVALTCWREIRDKPGYVLCNCCPQITVEAKKKKKKKEKSPKWCVSFGEADEKQRISQRKQKCCGSSRVAVNAGIMKGNGWRSFAPFGKKKMCLCFCRESRRENWKMEKKVGCLRSYLFIYFF